MIVETYFRKHTFAEQAQRIIDELTKQLPFRIDRPLFRGSIYDTSRLGSIIFKGMYKKKHAVLKIQGLGLPRDEQELIEHFLSQNQSARIRAPHIYRHAPWDDTQGYGFTVMEYIDAPALLSNDPNEQEINRFMDFFVELKTKAIKKPWIEQTEHTASSIRFIRHRIAQWVSIAKDRGHFDTHMLSHRIQTCNNLLESLQEEIPMEFMHSHMTGREVRYDEATKQFVLFGNLFWDWRPRYYDWAFVIWNIIKTPRENNLSTQQILDTISEWKKRFLALPQLHIHVNTEIHFDVMMLERLLGMLIIDLEAQTYPRAEQKNDMITHAFEAFDRLASAFA